MGKLILLIFATMILSGCGSGGESTSQAPTNPYAASFKGVYLASSQSDIYHYPACPFVQQITASNLISFNSENLAMTSGYRPCKTCKPPQGFVMNIVPNLKLSDSFPNGAIPTTLPLNITTGKNNIRFWVEISDINGNMRYLTTNVYNPNNQITFSDKMDLSFTGYEVWSPAIYAYITTSIAGAHIVEVTALDTGGLSTTITATVMVK